MNETLQYPKEDPNVLKYPDTMISDPDLAHGAAAAEAPIRKDLSVVNEEVAHAALQAFGGDAHKTALVTQAKLEHLADRASATEVHKDKKVSKAITKFAEHLENKKTT